LIGTISVEKNELLSSYLTQAGVKHEILEHKTVYTAIDAAKTLKRKMSEVAKSLLVKADRDYYLVLLPADRNLDFEKLRKVVSKEKGKEVKVTRLARGLPMGGDLEYIDDATILRAMEGRTAL